MAKDNILLITTDQQRFDTLNAWGNQSIFTPHLNYMAAMGISYKNCYASCPICVPSRTTIMTGRQGYESGVISNATHETFMRACTEERSTLPAVLTDAGYQTCAKGKMHFEPARAHYGFEHMKLPLDYMREYDKKQVLAHPKAHGVGECEAEPVISTVDVKDSITSWIAEESIDFLETRDTTRPFFLWTSFTKPHPPFDPCRDFWELYDNIPMPDAVTGDWSRTVEETPQGFLAGSYENTNLHLFGKEQRAASKRAYYACITQVDYALGRIFGCLRENDLFKNTWIIFTADHGEMLGDHHMSQKNLFFEGSAHVPLLIMPPQGRSLPQNISVEAPTDLVDLYPTILAMAGLSSPVSVSGRNHGSYILWKQFKQELLCHGGKGEAGLLCSRRSRSALRLKYRSHGTAQPRRGSCLAGTQGKALEASAGAYRTVYARGAGREGSVPYLRSPPLPRRCARTVVWFPLS